MMAVLEQGVADGLRAVDEQAAVEAALFLGDSMAAAVLANEDDGGCRTARGRFDELHVGIPSDAVQRHFRMPRTGPSPCVLLAMFGWLASRRFTHAANIIGAGYEFEGDIAAIS